MAIDCIGRIFKMRGFWSTKFGWIEGWMGGGWGGGGRGGGGGLKDVLAAVRDGALGGGQGRQGFHGLQLHLLLHLHLLAVLLKLHGGQVGRPRVGKLGHALVQGGLPHVHHPDDVALADLEPCRAID